MTGDDLVLRTQRADPGASAGAPDPPDVEVITVAGPLRLPEVPRVLGALARTLRHRAPVVVCDVSRLTAPGGRALLAVFPAALHRAGGWPYRSLHLAGGGPDLVRQLEAQHMSRFLPVHRTLEGGLAAARADLAGVRERLTLSPDAAGLHRVRDAVRDLWPAVMPPRSGPDDAALLAHELAGNAIRHGALPLTLTVTVSARRMTVAVSDRARQEPVVRPPGGWGEDGRGMHLVDGLSEAWGVRLVHPAGKTVWARLPTRAAVPVPRSRAPRSA